MRRFSVLLAAVLAAALLVACDADAPDGLSAASTPSRSTPAQAPATASTLPTPTQPAIPDRIPARGAPSATCVNGWTRPPEDSPDATDPLGIIRRTTGVQAPFEVVDLRMFIGPESPPSDKGYLVDIRRWYIQLYAPEDLAFQGRFIVEQRRFGRGLAAVAPYDTEGFRSPDWRAFQYDSTDTEPRAVPGLPGAWTGVEYDFVTGGEGVDLPGLPDEVVGCLEATS